MAISNTGFHCACNQWVYSLTHHYGSPVYVSQCCFPLCFSSDLILSVYTSDMELLWSHCVDNLQRTVSHEIVWILFGLSGSINPRLYKIIFHWLCLSLFFVCIWIRICFTVQLCGNLSFYSKYATCLFDFVNDKWDMRNDSSGTNQYIWINNGWKV